MTRSNRAAPTFEDALWFDSLSMRAARPPVIRGTAGDDVLIGTRGNDRFNANEGGDDFLRGGGGNDKFAFGDSYTDADVVYGGGRKDVIFINNMGANQDIKLNHANLRGVEFIKLSQGTFYITLEDAGQDLHIKAVGAASRLFVDGSRMSIGAVRLSGGISSDTLIGGDGDDRLLGGANNDVLHGGKGNDTFVYQRRSDSDYFFGPDTISDFSQEDKIVLPTRYEDVDDYHLGATPGRVGDIIVSVDEFKEITTLEIFLDADSKPDMIIDINGLYVGLQVVNSSEIVIG